MAFPSPTKTYHTATYDAISPSLPALTQKGKNVIITGGGTGIGRGIALSFAKASASHIALLGRRLKPLEDTKNLITTSYPNVSVYVYRADVTDTAQLNTVFTSFAKDSNGPIHTLVANAGVHLGYSKAVDLDGDMFMKSLEANALGTLNTFKAFIPHVPIEPDSTGFRARIIHTSSAAVQLDMPTNMTYAIGKFAAAKVMQQVDAEHPDIFVLNYHPGLLETEMSTNVKEGDPVFEFPDNGKSCYLF